MSTSSFILMFFLYLTSNLFVALRWLLAVFIRLTVPLGWSFLLVYNTSKLVISSLYKVVYMDSIYLIYLMHPVFTLNICHRLNFS